MYIHTYVHTYIHTSIYTYVHTYIYITFINPKSIRALDMQHTKKKYFMINDYQSIYTHTHTHAQYTCMQIDLKCYTKNCYLT